MYIMAHASSETYNVKVEFLRSKKEANRYMKSILAKPEKAFLSGSAYTDDRLEFSTSQEGSQNIVCSQNMMDNMYRYACVDNIETGDAIWWEIEPVDEKIKTDKPVTNVYYVLRADSKDKHTTMFQFQDIEKMIHNVLEQKKLAVKKFGADAEERVDSETSTQVVRNKATGEEIWWNLYGYPVQVY